VAAIGGRGGEGKIQEQDTGYCAVILFGGSEYLVETQHLASPLESDLKIRAKPPPLGIKGN
jgi:hypothetical protein